LKQEIKTIKMETGFSVEIIHDSKIIWTDFYKTKVELDLFLNCCNYHDIVFSQDEARNELEKGVFGVDCLYKHPKDLRFASIFNCNVASINKGNYFEVYVCNNKDEVVPIRVFTLDEVFEIIKKAENNEL
jgi:hypothetical protein